MKTYVVVEGQVDVELLSRLLGNRPALDIKILTASGRSSVLSLARTLLLSKDLPVLLVVDLDDGELDEVSDVLERGLGQVAPSRRWKCVVFDPDIETELLALLPATRRKTAKTKAQRRSVLLDALKSNELRPLPKLKQAIAFIEHWNRSSADAVASL